MTKLKATAVRNNTPVTQPGVIVLRQPLLADKFDLSVVNNEGEEVLLNAINQQYFDSELDSRIFPQNEIPFTDPAEEWIWMHNMNKKPSVEVIVSGQVVSGRVEHLDNDTLKVTFSKPQTGSIIVR